MAMLQEIHVYGQLAKFVGRRKFKAAVSSAAEAVRFLVANFPGVERHMSEEGRYYKVTVGGQPVGIEELHGPSGQQVIKIVPVVGGAGGVGRTIGQIVVGVALVAAAIAIPGLGLGLAGATVTQIGILGGALILGGVSQLLTPTPQISTSAVATGGLSSYGGNNSGTTNTELDPQNSYSFNGIQNVSRAGLPVPVILGETVVGSIVISAGIDTVQIEG